MAEFGPDARAFLQSHIDDHGFLSWLGVRVDAVDPGHVVMRVPYSDDLTNPRLAGGCSHLAS
jgi:acyl-coenzyme A thioesterase PaaI-like protein